MIKELKPFINIPAKPFYMKDINSFGMLEFENLEKLRAGRDNLSMHFDERGLWLGHENFADAPFKVHINGVLEAPAVFAGYIEVGDAAADVNAHATRIAPGLVQISGTTTLANMLDSTNPTLFDAERMAIGGSTIIAGGYIQTVLINADSIQAGIITGRRLQTRAEGAWTRIMIGEHGHPSYPDQIVFFNLHGDMVGTIRGAANEIGISGHILLSGNLEMVFLGLTMLDFDVAAGDFGFNGVVYPLTDNARDLGKSNRRWRHIFSSGTIYANEITATAIATTGLSVGSVFRMPTGGTLPSTCLDGNQFYKTGTDFGAYVCVNNAWERLHSG